MNTCILVWLTIIALLLPHSRVLAACECSGKSSEHKFEGGDRSPLTWYSLQRVEHMRDPPIRCYERSVRNHGKTDVRDVYWPVAGYRRDVVPPNPDSCCCQAVSIPGSLKQPVPSGPLYYGPGGGSAYPTTSYAPKDGWLTIVGQTDILPEGPPEPLTSVIEFAITNSGATSVSRLYLVSLVSSTGGKYTYQYKFLNKGREPILVYWDIPKTREFEAGFRMEPDDPLLVPPEKDVSRTIESSEVPAWAYTTVAVFDAKLSPVALGMASVYGFAKGSLSKIGLDYRRLPQK